MSTSDPSELALKQRIRTRGHRHRS